MNKKSLILSVVLAGSFLTPQQTYSGPPALAAYALWTIGMITTTTVTTGYLIKGRIQKYNRARNFIKKQKDIKHYQATLTVLPRVKNTRKFDAPLARITFSDNNYETVIEKVENFLKEFDQTQLATVDKNTVLRFVIETAVTSKDEKSHKLKTHTIHKKLYLSPTLTAYDRGRITKILNDKFYIPKCNIRYKKKAFLGFFGAIALITAGALGLAG